jgi:hypothetical protein
VLIVYLACWHRQVVTTCATECSCPEPGFGSSRTNIVATTIEKRRIRRTSVDWKENIISYDQIDCQTNCYYIFWHL